jgi:hypothetical protein
VRIARFDLDGAEADGALPSNSAEAGVGSSWLAGAYYKRNYDFPFSALRRSARR